MKKLFLGFVLGLFLIGNCLAIQLPEVPVERWLVLEERITEFNALSISLAIMELDQRKGDIRIYICSPGGDANAGLTIIDAIKTAKNDIQVVGVGEVYSMAVYIFVSCTKGKRVLFEHGEIYTHSVGFSGMVIPNKEQKEKREKLDKILKKILMDNSNMTEKDVVEWNERIMFLENAINLGVADGVYEGEKRKEE